MKINETSLIIDVVLHYEFHEDNIAMEQLIEEYEVFCNTDKKVI